MMSQGETMERVRVKPSKLIKALQENFERHKKEYQAAYSAYKKLAAQALEERLKELASSSDATDQVDLRFDLSPPSDHREDYERAIGMLTWCEDETVTLTSSQYSAFVQDKWAWKDDFVHRNKTIYK